jgi:hypothetical protein
MTWLTPHRLRYATMTLFVAACGFSSLTLAGSTPSKPHSTPTASIQSR